MNCSVGIYIEWIKYVWDNSVIQTCNDVICRCSSIIADYGFIWLLFHLIIIRIRFCRYGRIIGILKPVSYESSVILIYSMNHTSMHSFTSLKRYIRPTIVRTQNKEWEKILVHKPKANIGIQTIAEFCSIFSLSSLIYIYKQQ